MTPHVSNRAVFRPAAVVLVAALAAILSVALIRTGPAGASALTGTAQTGAEIINPTTEAPLTGVNASTAPFEIQVPAEAACTGDTTGQGYHIYGYLVTSTTSPGSLTYNSVGPDGGFPLIEQSGQLYSAINTVPTTGAIPEPTPALVFGSNYGTFGSHIVAGTYNLGISCATSAGAADKYWHAQVTFTASSSDPNKFTWKVKATATTTTLTASPTSPEPSGTAVTLTATLTPTTAVGSVKFLNGKTALGTVKVAKGKATFTTKTLAVGTHSLTAVFTPSNPTAFATSTSKAVSYVITKK